MDKKYLTDKTLLSLTVFAAVVCVILLTLYFIDIPDLSDGRVGLLLGSLAFALIVVHYVRNLLFYPVFDEECFHLKNIFFSRLSVSISYKDICYARVERKVERDYFLRVFLELKDGTKLSRRIMTSVCQQPQLFVEFESRGIGEVAQDAKLSSKHEEFKNVKEFVLCMFGILFLVGLEILIIYLFPLWVSIILGVVCTAVIVANVLFANYLILDGEVLEIKNYFMSFRNVRFHISDVETAEFTKHGFLRIVRRGDASGKGGKTCSRYLMIDSIQEGVLSAKLQLLLQENKMKL